MKKVFINGVALGLFWVGSCYAEDSRQPWFKIISPVKIEIRSNPQISPQKNQTPPPVSGDRLSPLAQKDVGVQAGEAVSPPSRRSLDDLLRKADELMRNGKPAEVYALLEPAEEEYSGELGFDYLLGVAALDSGKPDRATIAFERILVVDPNFAGARLDLARAYFMMGSDDLAQKEFETVLTQSPPPPVVEIVQRFLTGIEERRRAKIQQLTYYLETSAGYDDNITAATLDFTSGVCSAYGACTYSATGASIRYMGMYESLSGGFDFTRKVNEENGVSIFAGADIKKRVYNTVSLNNNANVDLRAGIAVAKEANIYRMTATYGRYLANGFEFDSNNNRDTAGLGTEWKHSFSERRQMTWSLQYSQPRYDVESAKTQDTNQVALSVSLLNIFEGAMSPLIFANLSRSSDRAVRTKSDGSDMSRTGSTLMMHSQFTPWANTDLFLSAGLSFRQDDTPNARSTTTATGIDFYAQDFTQNASVGVTMRPWQNWSLKCSLAWTRNISNLDLYKYQKLDSAVSLRRDF